MGQPENEKVYSLGDYVAVHSETNDWFVCVISEISDPSKEVKIQVYGEIWEVLLATEVKSWKSGSQSQQYFTDAPCHLLTIACLIPLMPSILEVYM